MKTLTKKEFELIEKRILIRDAELLLSLKEERLAKKLMEKNNVLVKS